MNEQLKKDSLNEEAPIESLYDTFGWNEKSLIEEDTIYIQRTSVKSEKVKGVKYVEEEIVTVPNFISNQVSAFEKCTCCFHFFCCHLCKKKGTKLEDIEQDALQSYNKFKYRACEVYNSEDSSHENSLRFLYVQTLNSDLTQNLINAKWRKLGFTANDPRIDIKIGGYFALLFINHFIMANEEEFELIQKEVGFSFAICAIIITLYLRLALDAFNSEKIAESMRKDNNIQPVSISQFINFCSKYNANPKYPFEILSNILLSAKDEIITTNCTSLNKQMNIMKEHFNKIFYEELTMTLEESTEGSASLV